MDATNRAQLSMALLPLALAFIVALCFAASAESRALAEESELVGNQGTVTWCIAKPSANYDILRSNIDYSCEQSNVDCRDIQEGGGCFRPENVISHASYAMNLFYRAAGKQAWDCHFNGTGLIVSNNPSIGNCNYPA